MNRTDFNSIVDDPTVFDVGEFNLAKWGGLTEMNARELVTVVPLMLLTLWIGIYPKPLNDLMNATLQNLVNLMAR